MSEKVSVHCTQKQLSFAKLLNTAHNFFGLQQRSTYPGQLPFEKLSTIIIKQHKPVPIGLSQQC